MRFIKLLCFLFPFLLSGCGGGSDDELGRVDAATSENKVTITQTDESVEFVPCETQVSSSSIGFQCGDGQKSPFFGIGVDTFSDGAFRVRFENVIKLDPPNRKYRKYVWRSDAGRGGSIHVDRNGGVIRFNQVDTSLWIGQGYDNMRIGDSAIISGTLTF